jgi:hypothetical protein
MPNQDGSLTGADNITLKRALNRMIPTDDAALGAGTLGLLAAVQERAESNDSTRSAFMRIVEALSLDMLSHAVGGFSALTEEEQITSLRNVEGTLPREFSALLGLVRDVYYEDGRTPARPSDFDGENEIFGKVSIEEDLQPKRNKLRSAR